MKVTNNFQQNTGSLAGESKAQKCAMIRWLCIFSGTTQGTFPITLWNKALPVSLRSVPRQDN